MLRIVSVLTVVALSSLPQAHANSLLSVEKTVNNTEPAAGELVEFVITIANVGNLSADGIIVRDKLPETLTIPQGMSAYTSVGTYSPASGVWEVGSLAPDAVSVLTIPAMVTTPDPPPCIANTVTLVGTDDTEPATAILKLEAGASCVDLAVRLEVEVEQFEPFECSYFDIVEGRLLVHNRGTDAAEEVVIGLEQPAPPAPAIYIDDSRCHGASPDLCAIGAIEAGELVSLPLRSAAVTAGDGWRRQLAVVAHADGFDVATINNNAVATLVASPRPACVPSGNFGSDFPAIGAYPACFIATAAYGSPLDPRLVVLRKFRDETLIRSRWGRSMVHFYYDVSPALAAWISGRPVARMFVRSLLAPIVFALEYPAVALAVLAIIYYWLLHAWAATTLRTHARRVKGTRPDPQATRSRRPSSNR